MAQYIHRETMLGFFWRGDYRCGDFLGAPAAAHAVAPVSMIALLQARSAPRLDSPFMARRASSTSSAWAIGRLFGLSRIIASKRRRYSFSALEADLALT